MHTFSPVSGYSLSSSTCLYKKISFSMGSSLVSMSVASSDGLFNDSSQKVSEPSRIESGTSVLKETEVEVDNEMEKYDDDGDVWGHEDVPTGMSENVSILTYGEPGSYRSIGRRSSLEVFFISKCHNVRELPDSLGELTVLKKIRLNGMLLKELPQTFRWMSRCPA